MDELITKLMHEYAKILPQDLRDTEVFMSRGTWDALKVHTFKDRAGKHPGGFGDTIYGLRVRIDANLPDGVAEMRTESEFDRAIRRAAREGSAVNVMRPVLPPIEVPLVIEPTVRSLLRAWGKKAKQAWKS